MNVKVFLRAEDVERANKRTRKAIVRSIAVRKAFPVHVAETSGLILFALETRELNQDRGPIS